MEYEKWSNLKTLPFLSFLSREMYVLICHRSVVQWRTVGFM